MIKLRKYFVIIIFMTTAFSLSAQDSSEAQYNLFKSKAYVKNPLDLRDPFKRRLNKKKIDGKSKNHFDGVYSNAPDSIENRPIENIKIIGVVIGAQRRAMAKVIGDGSNAADPNVYFIKEGMKIGENGAEVKAILPGGVVLVEKIRNVYDQDEYLETVIPVSSD